VLLDGAGLPPESALFVVKNCLSANRENGWVNWSGLATLLANIEKALAAKVDWMSSHSAPSSTSTGWGTLDWQSAGSSHPFLGYPARPGEIGYPTSALLLWAPSCKTLIRRKVCIAASVTQGWIPGLGALPQAHTLKAMAGLTGQDWQLCWPDSGRES
jgi:hypothetical protein